MQIVPIRDLRNTNEISERCRQSAEPIFVTKNGYCLLYTSRLAPAVAPPGRDTQRLCQQILLGVDQIDQPPQTRRGVLAEAYVDVDAAGGVGLRARLAQGADYLLDLSLIHI